MTAHADRAAEGVEFIRQYTADHGYPPSRRELSAHFGLHSPQGGHLLIDELVRQGLVEVDPKVPRAIRLTVGKALTEEG